jgi:general secretion pathway protein C
MVKKIFFLAYVVIGVFVLFQASKLVATVIEKRLSVYELDTSIEPNSSDVSRFSPVIGYDESLLISPLFSVYETVPEGEVEEEDVVSSSPILRKYELNGVILLGGNRSIALIRKAGQRTSDIYRKGDRLDNLEIVKIERDRVYLNDGRNNIVLPMYYKYQNRTASAGRAERPVQRPSSDALFSNAKQIKKVLSRSDVESKVFQRVNEILTQIAIAPYMKDGQMEGLRLARVPRDNIVYELGGRSGDIVRRVNGHEVNQIEQMYKLWENIKDDAFITVDLERNNQIFSFNFEIRE